MLEDEILLEHYSSIKLLGKGVQGEVYLVEDKRKNKYAFKVYNNSVTKKEIRREIKLLMAIKHPHVIDIKKYGVLESGRVYTITQYVEDGGLDDPLKVVQIPIKEKIRIFTQVAHGLMYLHENGVIHRDIKPANIYVKKKEKGYKGYIGDFGLARHITSATLQRSKEGVMGTELFLPFEIFTEEKKKLDAATDVYALGISMYVTCTGVYPYGKEMKELVTYLRDPRPPIEMRKHKRGIPKELDILCYKMIQIEREGRVDDARRCYQYLCDIMKGKKLDLEKGEMYKKTISCAGKEQDKHLVKQKTKIKQKAMIALGLGAVCIFGGYVCSKTADQISGQETIEELLLKVEKKNTNAMKIIGDYYFEGKKGVEQNYTKAKEWYENAATKGNSEAYTMLGDMYYYGVGVEMNNVDALAKYIRGFELGDKSRVGVIGILYEERSERGNKSMKEAMKYYMEGAQVDDPLSLYRLGRVYLYGKIEKKPNYVQAKKYYELAIEKGSHDALVDLGDMYYSGLIESKQNYEAAFMLYMEALLEGNTLAMKKVGMMYENGEYVEKSYEKAKKYYLKVAELGDKKAQIILRQLESKMKKRVEKCDRGGGL